MATLSQDLRERIVAAYDRGDGTRQQIADRFCVSLGMVKKLLQQRRRTGDIAPRHRYSGAKPKITAQHQRHLKRLVRDHPDMTLDELREAIEPYGFIRVACENLDGPPCTEVKIDNEDRAGAAQRHGTGDLALVD